MVGTRTYTAGMKAAEQSLEQSLFTPGTGAIPPTLAGREQEQMLLNRCLTHLAGGGSLSHDVVLIGPRGNGKTVLLRWFEDACRKARVDVVHIAPGRVRTGQALCNALLPATGRCCACLRRRSGPRDCRFSKRSVSPGLRRSLFRRRYASVRAGTIQSSSRLVNPRSISTSTSSGTTPSRLSATRDKGWSIGTSSMSPTAASAAAATFPTSRPDPWNCPGVLNGLPLMHSAICQRYPGVLPSAS